jgi:Leucine-rich repeat (LRR) protein
MCQVCTDEYDENTIALDCYGCKQVTSIPSNLPNLQYLYCRDTNVTSIPYTLVNLLELYCSDTKVTSIPSTLVNLERLSCSDTNVTSIPSTFVNLIYLSCNNTPVTYIPPGIQDSFSDDCHWLDPENITKLIPIQKRFKNKFKIRRSNELLEYFYTDIISLIL